MSSWQNASPAESHPFPFYMEQAAQSVGDPCKVAPLPPRGILWTIAKSVRSGWQWLQRTRATQIAARRLRVTETVSLGDKRFLSIVQVDGAQFLIGTSAARVQLLAQLEPQPDGTAQAAVETRESA